MRKRKNDKPEEGAQKRERRWAWFFQGFGVGVALAALVAGLIVENVIVPWLEQKLLTEATPASVVNIVPDISLPIPGQVVMLTPVLDGKAMEPPVHMVWSANCGKDLPKGFVAVKPVLWRAPGYTIEAHITATVKDAVGSVAKGRLVLPVVTPSPPVGSSQNRETDLER